MYYVVEINSKEAVAGIARKPYLSIDEKIAVIEADTPPPFKIIFSGNCKQVRQYMADPIRMENFFRAIDGTPLKAPVA